MFLLLQLDKLERGFGFESETLDMRMNQDQSLDAGNEVNHILKVSLKEYLKSMEK